MTVASPILSESPQNAPAVACQPTSEGPFAALGSVRREQDVGCGFEFLDGFQRFNQANDIFNRGQWDERIRSPKVIDWFKGLFSLSPIARDAEGYTTKDFALRLAGWVGANLTIQRSLHLDRVDGFLDPLRPYSKPNPQRVTMASPVQMSAEIKQVSRLFGADDVGITGIDPRLHYSAAFSMKTKSQKVAVDLAALPHVIVVLSAMNYRAVQCYPSATAGVAVGHGYSRDCALVQEIATYISNLGYRAVASVNDTSLAIPYAIAAGLGEYGRNGLLINRNFGPRVRIGRIHTDVPLKHDVPESFGVREFCDSTCRRCAQSCPPKAISFGAPTEERSSQSTIVGVRKWQVDPERCFKFWVKQGAECGICMRVCPYNKDTSRWTTALYFRLWRRLAASPFKKFALSLDILLGFGRRMRPTTFWRRIQSN